MTTLLSIIQIIVSILLIISVLLQNQGTDLGSAFGGGDDGTTTHTRRGFEKTVFQSTIALGIIFAITSFALFLIG